ncbi:unnamed protein product [marine sediment metagenome]|uniref:Uncharacterized protein n=1 Tax=marine sediment metagenome TaxID=412755 RepID=X0VVV8_9ZZZZ
MGLLENEEVTIIRPGGGSYVKGHYSELDPLVIIVWASVQPINDDELLLLSEGNRNAGTLKFYSESEIKTDDVLRRKKYNSAQENTCTVDTGLVDTDYTCTINETVFTYNSSDDTDPILIVAGLVSQISAGSEPITVTDNLDGTYTVVGNVYGTPFIIAVDANQSFVVDVINVVKEYKALQNKDYSVHSISYYKVYGFLMGK